MKKTCKIFLIVMILGSASLFAMKKSCFDLVRAAVIENNTVYCYVDTYCYYEDGSATQDSSIEQCWP